MKLFIATFLLLASNSSGSETFCPDLFSFTSLNDSIRELAKLRLELDTAKAINSGSPAISALNNEFTKKESALGDYLEQNAIMSHAELIQRIREEIHLIQKGIDRSEEIETRKIEKMEIEKYIAIDEKGSFNTVKIDQHHFQLLSTPTTQVIWRKVAELINERLGGVKMSMFGKRTKLRVFQPSSESDMLPMHSVSYEDINQWFVGLNELSNKKAPELKEILQGHNDRDHYYLPIEVEWRALIETANLQKYSLGQIAWYEKNSNLTHQLVGEANPVMIADQLFFDLLGNVRVWIKGKNSERDHEIVWGMGYNDTALQDAQMPVSWKAENLGFRICRKVRIP